MPSSMMARSAETRKSALLSTPLALSNRLNFAATANNMRALAEQRELARRVAQPPVPGPPAPTVQAAAPQRPAERAPIPPLPDQRPPELTAQQPPAPPVARLTAR